MSATVAVPVETLQAIVNSLGSIMVAAGEVSVQVDDIIRANVGADPQEQPVRLAPVVRLADYRQARGGAA